MNVVALLLLLMQVLVWHSIWIPHWRWSANTSIRSVRLLTALPWPAAPYSFPHWRLWTAGYMISLAGGGVSWFSVVRCWTAVWPGHWCDPSDQNRSPNLLYRMQGPKDRRRKQWFRPSTASLTWHYLSIVVSCFTFWATWSCFSVCLHHSSSSATMQRARTSPKTGQPSCSPCWPSQTWWHDRLWAWWLTPAGFARAYSISLLQQCCITGCVTCWHQCPWTIWASLSMRCFSAWRSAGSAPCCSRRSWTWWERRGSLVLWVSSPLWSVDRCCSDPQYLVCAYTVSKMQSDP